MCYTRRAIAWKNNSKLGGSHVHLKNHTATLGADWSEVEALNLDTGTGPDWLHEADDTRLGQRLKVAVTMTAKYATTLRRDAQRWAWLACWEHCAALFEEWRHRDDADA
jgi:hypothetical protein